MEGGVLVRPEAMSAGRMCGNIPVGKSVCLRKYGHSCFDGKRGNQIKVCCSATSTPSHDIGSSSGRLFLNGNTSMDLSARGEHSKASVKLIHVLDCEDDEYGGVIVNSEELPRDAKDFGFSLHVSLSYWRSKKKKGVWLKLPLDLSELVPVAVKEGFKYHHAEEEYLMLTYWLPEGPSMLPANASHQVGVGGFVINDKNEILVVQERYCASEVVWKLPTGFINQSEEIFDGVVREVEEETGVETEFLELVAFRHAHCVAFKKSDLFFMCMLRPLTTQIKIDGLEIQAAKWMPLVEFVEQPFIQSDDMFRKITEICIARLQKQYCGLLAHHVISKFDGKSSSLYYNVSEVQDFPCRGN